MALCINVYQCLDAEAHWNNTYSVWLSVKALLTLKNTHDLESILLQDGRRHSDFINALEKRILSIVLCQQSSCSLTPLVGLWSGCYSVQHWNVLLSFVLKYKSSCQFFLNCGLSNFAFQLSEKWMCGRALLDNWLSRYLPVASAVDLYGFVFIWMKEKRTIEVIIFSLFWVVLVFLNSPIF